MPQNLVSDKLQRNLDPDKVQRNLNPDKVQRNLVPDKVPQNLVQSQVQFSFLFGWVTTKYYPDEVPQNIVQGVMQQNLILDKIPPNIVPNKVQRNLLPYMRPHYSHFTKQSIRMHLCCGVQWNPEITKSQNIPGNDQLGFPESFSFSMMSRGSGGIVWAKVAPSGTIWPPRKSAFNYEKGPFEPQFHWTAVMELNSGEWGLQNL